MSEVDGNSGSRAMPYEWAFAALGIVVGLVGGFLVVPVAWVAPEDLFACSRNVAVAIYMLANPILVTLAYGGLVRLGVGRVTPVILVLTFIPALIVSVWISVLIYGYPGC